METGGNACLPIRIPRLYFANMGHAILPLATPARAIISWFEYSKALLIIPKSCDYYITPLSSVNLLIRRQYGMEMFESIGWIVLGFAPTLVAMEAAWRAGKRRLALAEAMVR
jgi:hypothetical protein